MKTSNFLTLNECVRSQLSSQAQPVTQFAFSPVFMRRKALLRRDYDKRTMLHTTAPAVLPEVPSRPVSPNNLAQSLYVAYAKARKSTKTPRERDLPKTDNAGFRARQGQFRSGSLFTKDSAYKRSLFPAATVSIQLKELTESYARYQQISATQNRKFTYKKVNDIKTTMCGKEVKREIQPTVLGNREGKRSFDVRNPIVARDRQKSETPKQSRKPQRASPEPSVLSGISQLLMINHW